MLTCTFVPCKRGLRDRFPHWDEQYIQKIFHERKLDLRSAVEEFKIAGEHGIFQQPGPHQVRLCDAEILVSCLQMTIAQQGDLHGGVRIKRLGQHLVDARLDCVIVGRAIRPLHLRGPVAPK